MCDKELSKRIKKIRKLNRETQIDLSKKAGVPQSNISVWESSRIAMPANFLIKIAQAYDISLDYFDVNINVDDLSLEEIKNKFKKQI